jgi:hypothetical protein
MPPLLVAMQRNLCPLRIRQQSTFDCCWLPVLSFDLATQLMPAAHPPAKYLCLLLATFACDLATQLMPAAHKQPLLLAMQRKGNRGGKSATQLMPGAQKQGRKKGRQKCNAKAQGDPCLGATGTRAKAVRKHIRHKGRQQQQVH